MLRQHIRDDTSVFAAAMDAEKCDFYMTFLKLLNVHLDGRAHCHESVCSLLAPADVIALVCGFVNDFAEEAFMLVGAKQGGKEGVAVDVEIQHDCQDGSSTTGKAHISAEVCVGGGIPAAAGLARVVLHGKEHRAQSEVNVEVASLQHRSVGKCNGCGSTCLVNYCVQAFNGGNHPMFNRDNKETSFETYAIAKSIAPESCLQLGLYIALGGNQRFHIVKQKTLENYKKQVEEKRKVMGQGGRMVSYRGLPMTGVALLGSALLDNTVDGAWVGVVDTTTCTMSDCAVSAVFENCSVWILLGCALCVGYGCWRLWEWKKMAERCKQLAKVLQLSQSTLNYPESQAGGIPVSVATKIEVCSQWIRMFSPGPQSCRELMKKKREAWDLDSTCTVNLKNAARRLQTVRHVYGKDKMVVIERNFEIG